MSTITITPTVEASNWPPRIRLDVSDANLPAYIETTVVRLHPDGRTVPVRTPDGGPLQLTTSGSNQIGTLYDYEAPFGQPVSYTTSEDPVTISAEVTVDDDAVWLVHVGVPELSMPVELGAGSLDEETWAVNRGVFWPQGREFPVVHTDGVRKAPATTALVSVESLSDLARVRALMRDTGTLFLNIPVSMGLGFDTAYVAVGDVKSRRLSDVGSTPNRVVELPLQVVDRPAGGTQADRTWSDVLSGYASWAAVMAAYDTWQDVLSGP